MFVCFKMYFCFFLIEKYKKKYIYEIGKEAFDAGMAPLVNLEATNIKVLEYIKLEDLLLYDLKKAMSWK